MTSLPPVRQEIRRISQLALPVVGAQVGTMAMGTVDTLMLGRVGVDALAAAGIANAWIHGILLAGQGLIHGIDPIVSQAHGARDGKRAALALQRAVVLALLISIPSAAGLAFSGPALLGLGQDPELAALAERYAWVQIPSIPCFLLFVALRQYLQCRELVRPALWVVGFANLFNALANWALIFGNLGLPALGLEGAGIATMLTRAFMLLGLWLLVVRFELHRGAWTRWSRRVLAPRGLGELLALGVPVALQMSLEIWAFSAATLLAGRLGAASASAHVVALNMAALSFMMPLGISMAAATRVGNLLGAERPRHAQRAAWLSIALGAGVMGCAAIAFVTLRHGLPRLYTADPEVVLLASSVLPIMAAFQIFDGTQVVGCGVLRGMGRTRPAAVFNFVGYWLVGLPLAAWLGQASRWGLAGLWWGLFLGLGVVACLLVVWIRARGPAHAALRLAGPPLPVETAEPS